MVVYVLVEIGKALMVYLNVLKYYLSIQHFL